MLKYAWKADPVKGDSCAGQAGNDAATVAANAEPMKDGVAAVKTAIEGVYDCLGITCTDVGAYQASGDVKSGMAACTFAPSNDVDSTASSGATVPMNTDS